MNTSLLWVTSNDIVLNIMEAAPDFPSLNAITRSCTKFCSLFENHQFGVCESVAKNQFGVLWKEALNLLFYQGKLKRQSEKRQWEIVNPEIEWGVRKHFWTQDKYEGNEESIGLGILQGGTRVGIAESVELMNYARRMASRNVEVVVKNGILWTGHFTPEDRLRSDRAFLRYWLLLLACSSNWDTRRTTVEIHRAQGTLTEYYVEQAGRDVKKKEEDEKNERLVAEPFLQYPLCGLEDMLIIGNAKVWWNQMPGSMEQAGGHYWQRWNESANMLVQLQAERYLEDAILDLRVAMVAIIQ